MYRFRFLHVAALAASIALVLAALPASASPGGGEIQPGSSPDIAASATYVQISAGYFHACALQTSGEIDCWGDAEEGATIVPAGTYKAVSAGNGFTCAIRSDDTLACWGYGANGQADAPSGTFRSVSAGGGHACAVRTDWTVECWGHDAYGQASPPSGSFLSVSSGYRHTCGLVGLTPPTDLSIACWGSDEDGQSTPPTAAAYREVSAGGFHTCALPWYSVNCWGYDGDGESSGHPPGTYLAVSAGLTHSCGLLVGGAIACWGSDDDGEASPPGGSFSAVSAGAWFSCALDMAGSPVCWGWNYYNQATTSEPAPATYVPIAPTRLLDSRVGNGRAGKFKANVPRTFQIAGRGPVPADAVAVTGNFTVTRQTASGYGSITPLPTSTPTTSTINFPRGDNRANNVTATLGPGGTLAAVYKAGSGQTTDFVFDVTGYFRADDAGATYQAVTPVRLLDTRVANGLNGPFKARVPRVWKISGRGGIPANATAITGNLTVVGQSAAGYLSIGPIATAAPTTSNLNFPVGDIRPNGFTVKLAGNGTLAAVYMARTGASAHLVLDVTGYYVADSSGARFFALPPDRVLETRGEYWLGLEGKFKAKVARTLTVAARVGVPADATAVTGNLTVVNQTRAGYVSLTRTATNKPTTSTLNFPVRDIRANGVTSPIGPGGNVGLVYMAASGASTDLVLDISGYFRVVTETASADAPSPSAGPTTGTGRSTKPETRDLSRDPPR